MEGTKLFTRTRSIPLLLVLLQIVLGVFTVLNATKKGSFIWLAEAHQLVAMLLLLSLVWLLYIVRRK